MYDKAPPMLESLPDETAAFLAYLAERKAAFEMTGHEAKHATFAPDFPLPEGMPFPGDCLGMEFGTSEHLAPGDFVITTGLVTAAPQLCARGTWPRRKPGAEGPPAVDLAARVKAINKTFLERLRGETPTPPGSLGPVTLAVAGDKNRELVVLEFSETTKWFAFSPEQAVVIAELLIAKAKAVTTRPLVVNIG